MSGKSLAFLMLLTATAAQPVFSAAPGYHKAFGENSDVRLYSCAADGNGNFFVAGELTSREGLPHVRLIGSGGDYDAFVAKINRGGVIEWTAIIGGDGLDWANHVAVDRHGNVVIAGYTDSANFPVRRAIQGALAGQSDGFVCKLNPRGRLLFSTFLGSAASEAFGSVTVDRHGDIYAAGYTYTNAFAPLFANATAGSDVLVVKISRNGSRLIYAVYLGGSSYEYASDVAADDAGNAYVLGTTSSFDFPLLNSSPFDPAIVARGAGFLTKIRPDGTADFSTYFGGENGSYAAAIALDAANNIYVAGQTQSPDFPAEAASETHLPPNGSALYLLKLDATGTNVIYGHRWGASYDDFYGYAPLAVSADGTAFVAGTLDYNYESQTGSPWLVRVSPDGAATLLDVKGCGTSGELGGVALNRRGALFFFGTEQLLERSSYFVEKAAHARTLSGTATRLLLKASVNSSVAPLGPQGTTITLRATPVGFTNAVTAVQFFGGSDGNLPIGTATEPPFMIDWSNVEHRVYSIRAVAFTADGPVESCGERIDLRRPANDFFTDRISISGERVSVTGTTSGATTESVEEEFLTGPRSVWYTWTAPRDGAFEFSINELGEYNSLSIFTGDDLEWLTTVFSSAYYSGTNATLQLRGGVTYHIAVGSWASPPGFRLSVRPAEPPPNDLFENRIVLEGAPLEVTGTLQDATAKPAPPGTLDYFLFLQSVWYTWTAPETGLFHVQITDIYGPQIDVFTGDQVDALLSVGGYIAFGYRNAAFFQANAGETYQFRVSTHYSSTPDFTLKLKRISVPANDDFANRTPLTGAIASGLSSTIGATYETGEPLHPGSLRSGGSVWWTWTPPSNGVYLVTGGNIYYSGLGIYTGAAVNNLQTIAVGYYARIVLHAEVGTAYHIALDDQARESVTLNLRPLMAPVNDNFANAILLPNDDRSTNGSLENASFEPGEPETNLYTGSLWYRYIAPSNGFYSFQLSGGYTAQITVFRGDVLGGLQLLGTDDNYLVLPLEAGTEVKIAVASIAAYTTEFFLRVASVTPPPNDNFTNRIVLVGTNITFTTFARNATGGPHEPWNPSVWYSWTAPFDGHFQIQIPDNAGLAAVYTGDALTNLVWVAGGNSPVGFEAQQGVEYQIACSPFSYSWPPPPASVTLRLVHGPRPSNDNFADRAMLVGPRLSVFASLVGATAEPGEPIRAEGHTVWWTWTAPHSGRASIDTRSDFASAAVEVFTGTAISNLVRATPFENNGQRFDFDVQGGDVYQIQADTSTAYADLASIWLSLVIHNSPPNNHFTNRSGFGSSVMGTTLGATREPDEPTGGLLDPFGASVWWTWRAPATGAYEVRFLRRGEQSASVYTGDSITNLSLVPGLTFGSARHRFRATGGTDYHIQIQNGNGRSSHFWIEMVGLPAVPNDDFANRISLIGTNMLVKGSNQFATAEVDEPDIAFFPAERSTWWTWTAPADGTVTIDVLGALPYVVGVFTGTNLNDLTSVAEATDAVTFDVAQGTAYEIAIGAPPLWSGYENLGPYQFRLQFQERADGAEKSRRGLRLILPQGRQNVIESSTDLIHWSPFRTNTLEETEWFLIPRANEPQRFFRVQIDAKKRGQATMKKRLLIC